MADVHPGSIFRDDEGARGFFEESTATSEVVLNEKPDRDR
jgi:hypothetical protein